MIELTIPYDFQKRRFVLKNAEIQTAYPEMKDNIRDFVDELNRLPQNHRFCSLLFFSIIGLFFILSLGLLYLDVLWVIFHIGLLTILLLLVIVSEVNWKGFKKGIFSTCEKYRPIFEGFYVINNNFDRKENANPSAPYSIVLKAQMIDYAIDLANQYYAIKGAIPIYVYEEKHQKWDDVTQKKQKELAFDNDTKDLKKSEKVSKSDNQIEKETLNLPTFDIKNDQTDDFQRSQKSIHKKKEFLTGENSEIKN